MLYSQSIDSDKEINLPIIIYCNEIDLVLNIGK